MSRHRWGLLTVLMIVGTCAPLSWADPLENGDPVDAVISRYQLHPALNKLGRGVSNALGGWLEVPLNIQQRYVEDDTAESLFTGLAYGLVKGVVRTGVGVYEAVTCFLPYPEEYAPILPVLGYFKKKEGRQPLLLE